MNIVRADTEYNKAIGPHSRDMTRLGAAVPGLAGRVSGWAVNVIRRRRPPPPAVFDPPRVRSGMDPWLM